MFTHTFEYVDFNGVEREETHFFHLSAPEVVDLNFSANGDLRETLVQLKSERNFGEVIAIMQDIIKKSIGKKSIDGRNFRKSDEITDDFVSSPMYEQLYMKLATDPKFFADFITGITPKNLPSASENEMSEEELLEYMKQISQK